MLAAGLLWAGWYAFNGGSALAAGTSAAIVMVTTFTATCAATLAWLGVEKIKDGHVTGVGAASGAVAGLVAITPACGAVTPIGAIFVGLIAGAICPLAVGLKSKFGYDDSLDVVGVHLVGGVIGTLLIGLFASASMPNKTNGLSTVAGSINCGSEACRRRGDGLLVRGRLHHRVRHQEDDGHPHFDRQKKKRASTPSSTGTRREPSPPDGLRLGHAHSPAPAGPSQQTGIIGMSDATF
jgi:hypothetical protein